MKLKQIGTTGEKNGLFTVTLDEKYREGLKNIEGFSALNIIWWADQIENPDADAIVFEKPYTKGPDEIGVFATRSQFRPNPMGISTIGVKDIDHENGIIYTYYIDAFPGSQVLDIKPYLPSVDKLKNVSVPAWCQHWPDCIEKSGDFNWEAEFNFPS